MLGNIKLKTKTRTFFVNYLKHRSTDISLYTSNICYYKARFILVFGINFITFILSQIVHSFHKAFFILQYMPQVYESPNIKVQYLS